MEPFVATIISAHGPLEVASVTLDSVVFEPKQLLNLLAKHSLPARYEHDLSFAASGRQQVAELFQAVLSDWIDFIFVPTPKRFVIYADHDEFTTFYANTKSNLNRVVDALLHRGFERIENYERHL